MKKNRFGLGGKKTLIPALLLILTGFTPLFALDVTFTAPKFGGNSPIVDEINRLLEGIFSQYENEIGNTLRFIDINPKGVTGAFATSSVFTSTGATQRGYGGYDKFAVTVGAMGGIMGSNPFSFLRDMNSLLDDVENLNNLKLGFNPQVLNAQIGFNTSFLLDKLYLGLKLGYFKLDRDQITFSTPSIGVMANYQLLPQIRIPTGILVWRGINLGTGLIYQYTKMGIGIPLPSKEERLNIMGYNITTMKINSKLTLDFEQNTFTLPLDAVTSLRLLGFLNFSLGLGADLGFGMADFRLTGSSTASFENLPDFLNPIQNAGLSATTGGKKSPDIFNPKLMAGLGLSIGPVILDIPFTYYYLNNGYSLGITLGFFL